MRGVSVDRKQTVNCSRVGDVGQREAL